MDDHFLIEAKGAGKFRIRAIRAGLSGNGNYYPDAVLRQAVPLFEGARVFVKGDEEHLAGKGKDFRNLIGGLSEATFVPGKGNDSGEIQATLTMLSPEGQEATKLKEAVDRGLGSLFGFSIHAVASARAEKRAGRYVRVAEKFIEIKSVDLIVEPGAGGGVVKLIESKGTDSMTYLTETLIGYMIEASKLPPAVQKKLKKTFSGKEDVTEDQLREAIDADRETISLVSESGHVRMGDFPARAEPGERPKAAEMLDAFFDTEHKDHKHARSFKECYRTITGDRFASGRLGDCDLTIMSEMLGVTFRESLLSTSWSNVLGDSVTRRMVADYNTKDDMFGLWRRIATVNNASDFRTQERTRFGGYGNLPAVNQGAAYLPMASPTDEKATYAVTKRGGTEDITLEMIKNDDVGSIRAIPKKLAIAAKRTISEFVFDLVRTNPVIYDGVAWFHLVTHGNLGTTALDATSYAAARLAMLKQTEKDSGKRLSIPPRTLLVPLDVQEAAFNLFQRATENDKKFIATIVPDIVPVWYWTDTNDWALFADPDEAPAIEIGFLDGNEEPELFVQDNPSVGSMFSNDKLTYKIRHIYGGTVVDFRSAFKAVVP